MNPELINYLVILVVMTPAPLEDNLSVENSKEPLIA